MLNLFKKLDQVKPASVEVLDKPSDKHSYPEEVIMIHNEFNNAAEELLKQAFEVLDNTSKVNVEKAKRLASLGFTNSVSVQEGLTVQKTKEFTEQQIEMVNNYKRIYPNNKFITIDQVKQICSKWGLVMADLGCFKGFVPEKNLQDIEAFAHRYKILNKKEYLCEDGTTIDMTGTVIKPGRYGYYHFFNEGDTYSNGKVPTIRDAYAFQSSDGINFYGPGIINGKRYDLTDQRKKFNIENRVNPLSICAPLKDMDVEGQTLKNGFFFEKQVVAVHVPDPVVLHKVEHGYIIVTAWGDEASDPIIQN
jgi:hypothetical protein